MTRKPARAGVGKRPASGATNQAVTRGDHGPAAKQCPSSEVQPPSGPEASGARPQPSGSALRTQERTAARGAANWRVLTRYPAAWAASMLATHPGTGASVREGPGRRCF